MYSGQEKWPLYSIKVLFFTSDALMKTLCHKSTVMEKICLFTSHFLSFLGHIKGIVKIFCEVLLFAFFFFYLRCPKFTEDKKRLSFNLLRTLLNGFNYTSILIVMIEVFKICLCTTCISQHN